MELETGNEKMAYTIGRTEDGIAVAAPEVTVDVILLLPNSRARLVSMVQWLSEPLCRLRGLCERKDNRAARQLASCIHHQMLHDMTITYE